jgi:uncharacterized cofD-like protein
MSDGTFVSGESRIAQAGKTIRRIFIEPAQVVALPEAVQAVREADAIVFGPGSLYTSIIPNLLVPELRESILRSDALKIYICNVMTQPGETDGFSVGDHLAAIARHIGHRLFDYVIVNNGEIPVALLADYAKEGAYVVRLDLDAVKRAGYKVIVDQLVLFQTYLRHDAVRLSEHIYALVQQYMQEMKHD